MSPKDLPRLGRELGLTSTWELRREHATIVATVWRILRTPDALVWLEGEVLTAENIEPVLEVLRLGEERAGEASDSGMPGMGELWRRMRALREQCERRIGGTR